jgi:peptide/nickel transport system substrate-binding protein
MKRLLTVPLPALAVLTLAACGSGSGSSEVKSSDGPSAGGGTADAADTTPAGTPAKGGTLTIGAASGIPQLNPVIKGTAWEEALFPLLWDGLTKIDQDGKVAPDLATSWTSAQGGKTWTFTLRQGVKFSNGTPVTPKLVVANFKYYMDPDTATQQKTALAPIKSVTASGADKVVIKLKTPNVVLPDVLVPVKLIDTATIKTIDKQPAVTGPFKVKEFVPDDHLTLERNPDYFGDPAPLDEIKMVKAADATSAVTSLRSGDLDALWSVPSSDIPQLESQGEIQVVKPKVTGQYVSWEVDTTSPPFDDVRARQALAYAIDREAILKAAYYGQGQVSKTNTPLADNSPWFGGQLTDYSYNLDKAKQLFQEAGVTSFTWWGVAGQYPEWNTSAQILQASLKKIGVTMKIKNTELSTWPAKFYPAGKKFPGLVVPNFQSFATDPSFQLGFLRMGRCECNWKNDAFEKAYNDALATADEGARKAIWAKAQEEINKDVPIFVPVQSATDTAAQKKVVGLWVEASGTPHLESAGFAGQ